MTKLWLLALFIPFSQANAQEAPMGPDTTMHASTEKNVGKRAAESFMNRQIKYISDFINQFNAIVSDKASASQLLQLFNEDDPRLSASGRIHHAYGYQVRSFIQTVGTQHITIPKRGIMQAVTGIKVRYRGAPDTLTVYLRKDYTSDSAAYWHITGVKAPDALANEGTQARNAETPNVKAALPPNAHEVSFLPLLRGLHDYQSIAPFTHCRDCRDGDWRIVENALRNGELTAEAVVSNRIFLPLGNWEIELREFMREKENSGWLISDLIEK